MYFINGELSEWIAVNDRGLQFGDGCFTTARIADGNILLFCRHLARLTEACNRLAIPFREWDSLAAEMRKMALAQREGVLKAVITRGSGGRGYSFANCEQPTRILSVSSYPAHYARWKNAGINLALSPISLGRNPYLAGLKHLNRLEQVLIRSHLEQTDADEALVLDSEGWVTECCAANLFWRKGLVVYTPRLDQAGVNGIMRQFCMQMLAQSHFQVVEVYAKEDELMQADEMIVCNALMPVIPVRACGDTLFSSRLLFDYLAPLCEHPN
ncbi:aminodeoxychorismate lyase [Salmonella enterica subsp. houtenae serovar 43:z4,z23:-]|nr:aminodeoxychorismate lyase [Salmonella enterica subsp. houtenae serovar Houten]